MGRKTKYSKELKLEIIKRYINGESAILLANEYDFNGCHARRQILKWHSKYKVLGESAFDETSTNKTYSKDLKGKIIKEYLEGKDSFEGLANKYNISSAEIVRRWVLKYNDGIEIKA